MYRNIFETARKEIETTRSVIETHEKLRELQSQVTNSEELSLLVQDLIQILPKGRDTWSVYEHCSVTTRLYSIYESFVKSLIHEWIDRLPTIVQDYSQLDENIRKAHAANVGEILSNLCNKKDDFKDGSVKDTLEGLYHGVSGNQSYKLLRDAFSKHDQNLRKDILEDLFRKAGIHNHCWSWVQQHPQVNNIEDDDKAESKLKKFIEYRNEAAHGKVTEGGLLSRNLLLKYCDFTEAICLALSELVCHQTLERQKQYGLSEEIGKVKRFYPNQKVAEIKVDTEGTNILIGQKLYIARDSDGCSECKETIVESLRVNNKDLEEAIVNSESIKIELKLNIDNVKKNSIIYKLT